MSLKSFKLSDSIIRYAVIILSVLGLLVSLIIRLYIESGDQLAGCKVGSFFNCDLVINSAYGKVFGIPLSLLGAFYFICLLAFYIVDYRNDLIIAGTNIIGMLSVVNFVYLEIFVLDHFCLYCTSVHIIVILIFLLVGVSAIKNSYIELRARYLVEKKKRKEI